MFTLVGAPQGRVKCRRTGDGSGGLGLGMLGLVLLTVVYLGPFS